jgi:cytochrome c-type biogenesis protein CcmH
MSAIRKTILFLAAGFLAAGIYAGTAWAQEPTPFISDDEVNAIASEMFCPICENVPLDVCPTQACHQWRETIRQLLAEGMSEAEIKAYFVERHGDRVLAAPPRRGLNWLIYIVPPVVILIGALALVRTLRSWRVKTVPTGEAGLPPIPKDDYTRRLEDELERRA